MSSRNILKTALAHKEPERIPVDFGATAVTGMHVSVVSELREFLGLAKRPVTVHEPYQMLGCIEADLQEALGIDTEGIFGEQTIFGFPNTGGKEWRTPWGQTVLVPERFNTTTAADGSVFIYPEGDTHIPPCAKMPANGYFFDAVIRQVPLREETLDPQDNLEEFDSVSEAALSHFVKAAEHAQKTGRGIVATFGGTALGDVALVPAPFLKQPRGIRDIEEWYVSTVMRKDYVRTVFDRQTEIAVENLKTIHAAIGESVDVVYLCGTDFGTQHSQFCSIDTYRELYLPYYKKMNDWIHLHTGWKTFKHSCGAVDPFIPLFIESGFDILNPVQCSASGMDPSDLKRKYGKEITFWGGGIDTQNTLPFGRPDEVRKEVLKRCEIFAPNGGFIFAAIHNIQARTPVENVVAMFEAIRTFNGSTP